MITRISDRLGYEARDKITGYTGKIVAYAVYITGEQSVLVAGLDTTGRPIEEWINTERIDLIDLID